MWLVILTSKNSLEIEGVGRGFIRAVEKPPHKCGRFFFSSLHGSCALCVFVFMHDQLVWDVCFCLFSLWCKSCSWPNMNAN